MPDAGDYVVAQVWDEMELLRERKRLELADLAVAVQAATMTTGMAAGKDAAKAFDKFVKALTEG